ncbi:MAG: hypothetical protein GY938_10350 [Ketobacter sp.]|nr:hypothetical protein [Ketobacter sp.]
MNEIIGNDPESDNEESIWTDAHLKEPYLDMKQWMYNVLGKNKEDWSKYNDLFINDGWDTLDVIKEMNDEDLVELGINKKGHRIKIIKAINCLYLNNIN